MDFDGAAFLYGVSIRIVAIDIIIIDAGMGVSVSVVSIDTGIDVIDIIVICIGIVIIGNSIAGIGIIDFGINVTGIDITAEMRFFGLPCKAPVIVS